MQIINSTSVLPDSSQIAAWHAMNVASVSIDKELDAIAHIASLVCRVPMSNVLLASDTTSIGHSWNANQPRADATIFEVANTSLDPRFLDALLVSSLPNVRFYAGAPIVSASGRRLGTLNVMDRVSRTLDSLQLTTLRSLATVAGQLIDTRRSLYDQHGRVIELQRREGTLERASVMAEVGCWELDLAYNKIYWSHETCRIHGVTPGSISTLLEIFRLYAPESRLLLEAAIATSVATGSSWDMELSLVRTDGEQRWVRAMGSAELANGVVVRLVGAFQDISTRRQAKQALLLSETQFQGSFDAASHGIALISLTGSYLNANRSLCVMLGYSEAELLSSDYQHITHPDDLLTDFQQSKNLLIGRIETYRIQKRYLHKEGRVIHVLLSVSLVRTPDGTPVHFVSQIQDMTESNNATARLQTLLDTVIDGVHVIDRAGNLVQFSPSFAEMLGYSMAEMQLLNMRDWDLRIATGEWGPHVVGVLVDSRDIGTRYRRKDGSLIDVQINAKLIELDGIPYLYASCRDVTEYKAAERALYDVQVLAQGILDSVNNQIAVLDHHGIIIATNAAWRKFGADNSAEPGQLVPHSDVGTSYLDHCGADSNDRDAPHSVRRNLQAITEGRQAYFSCEYDCSSPTEQRWFSMTATVLNIGEHGAVVVHSDITLHKQTEELLHNLAYHDSLTLLANRRMLQEQFGKMMAISKRSGLLGAVLMLDLDNFKALNDSAGHAVGDLLLQEVAKRLSACVREVDTVARLGGDEFIVVIAELSAQHSTAQQLAMNVANKIRVSLSSPYNLSIIKNIFHSTVEHHCSTSIGVTLFSGREADHAQILKRADTGMYAAKAAGRNCAIFTEANEN